MNTWPARAYIYGTWNYAFSNAIRYSRDRRQKLFVYQGVLDGKKVWVASWDPKD